MHYIQSPINCADSKFKKLNILLPLFYDGNKFFDLFCGGANVGINSNCKNIILNDNNFHIIGLLKMFYNNSADKIINIIEDIIVKYNFQDNDDTNKTSFMSLRGDYNSMDVNNEMYYFYLMTLIVLSFNNQIRFNNQNKFNMPYGKKSFTQQYKQKIIDFCNKFQSLEAIITSNDYKYFENIMNNKSMVYIDIPYVNNAITAKQQIEVFDFLDDMNFKGIHFALSNYTILKGINNTPMIKWAQKYNIHDVNNVDGIQPTHEVLVTNY